MNKRILFLAIFIAAFATSLAAETSVKVKVHNATIPVLTDKEYNIVAQIRISNPGNEAAVLTGVECRIESGFPLHSIRSVSLMDTGGMSPICWMSDSWALLDEFRRIGGSQSIYCDKGYAIKLAEVSKPSDAKARFDVSKKLVSGDNYLYVSVAVDRLTVDDIAKTFSLQVSSVEVGGKSVPFTTDNTTVHRLGYGLRQSGDDNVYSYRIPGLVTTNAGALIAVYDIRYNTSLDLQDNIDIGMSRSTDGGRTWEPMKVIMDMGCEGGLPESQNGVGDPSVLVDETTGDIHVVAAWTHGLGNRRAWGNVGQGFEPETTAQLMMVSSSDNGLTWSAPRNLTRQVKDSTWKFTLQGPGRGITMSDGTLVFPIQHIDENNIPNAGIMYSKDHGKTWHTHNYAETNTTESQVAEIAPGCLMLNMRDNRRIGRAVATTTDLGKTWVKHHTSGGALREPVCMASLLQVAAKDNILDRDVLLFSNPDTTGVRARISIKASLDGGDTWTSGLLLDEDLNWGYSCMTMIDRETVGILYEGSSAQLLFQAVKLRDIVPTADNLAWEKVDGLPDLEPGYAKGVSAMFAGVSHGSLIVAGGSNFPETPAAMDGSKRFYKGIYSLSPKGKWTKAGELPSESAGGVTLAAKGKLYFIGGKTSDVLEVSMNGRRARVKELEHLPFIFEQGGGTVAGGTMYIAGGLMDGVASRDVFAADLSDGKWKKVAELPETMVQPVLAAFGNDILVWGGYSPFTEGRDGRTWCEGYRYSTASGTWSKIKGIPSGTMVGASCATLPDGRILCIGGVDDEVFQNAIELDYKISKGLGDASSLREAKQNYMNRHASQYKFNNRMYIYDPSSDTWAEAAMSERFARAGAGMVLSGDTLYIVNGERKPGVRVPDVWKVDISSIK